MSRPTWEIGSSTRTRPPTPGTAWAPSGRVRASTRAGELVSTFAQDSMARRVEGTLDFTKDM